MLKEGLAVNKPKSPQPNVLIIHTDQHRIGCLGAYGNKQIKTPHIDALAADGVRYDNSFCTYPVCTPSRYSLITGLYVHQHRGYNNHCTLPPGTVTFPALLARAGYRTKAVGKMHYTPTYQDVGFGEMELSEQNGPGRWDDDYHRYLRDRGLVDFNDLEDQVDEYRKAAPQSYRDNWGTRVSNLPDAHHSTTWVGDRAVETVETWNADRPSMLMVGFVKPHHPFDPPKKWVDMYDAEKVDILPGWTEKCLERDLAFNRGFFPHDKLHPAIMRKITATYYAAITQIDHHVGRMVDVLKRKGLYDSTLIIFTSDHGDYMGYHHMVLKGNYPYDPVMKVPLIVKYPGGKARGTSTDALVSNVDLAPTVLAACGVKRSAKMSGLDLAAKPDERDIVFAEASNGRQVMARTKTRKLILASPRPSGRKGKRGAPGESLLFDLEKDPFELTNLYDDPAYQHDVQALTKAARAWGPNGGPPKPYLNENAPVIKQPNVLGPDHGHRQAMIDYCRRMMAKTKAETE